jgi:hypothetical protein
MDGYNAIATSSTAAFHLPHKSGCTFGTVVRWSQLTIFLACNRALCSHEGQTEEGACGSLPHMWRKTRGKV